MPTEDGFSERAPVSPARKKINKNAANSATMHVAVFNVDETDAILYPRNSIGLVSQA